MRDADLPNGLFKNDALELLQQGELNPLNALMILGCTLLLSMLVYFVYKRSYKGVLYSKAYNISLVLTSLITSLVIMTIASNFVLSLGMVGALSIVRFRTAVKEALDIVFMFWAIAIGITCGAGFFEIAIIGTILIAAVLLVLDSRPIRAWNKDPYLLVVNYGDQEVGDAVLRMIGEEAGKYRIRSKTIGDSRTELSIEIRLGRDNHLLVDKVSRIEGVANVLLVSYTGDITG